MAERTALDAKSTVVDLMEHLLNQKELNRASQYLADDVEIHLFHKMVKGIDEWRNTVGPAFEALPDCKFTIEEIIWSDDKVACRWRAEGTFKRDLWGLEATGQKVEWEGNSFYEVKNGRVVKAWTFSDFAKAIRS